MILVVDDDPDIRDALGDFLEIEGYTVTSASNGIEALKQLQSLKSKTRPCVILLDLMMPAMDGYRFRELQKQDPALGSIPVIAVSAGNPDASTIDADAVLTKPLNLDLLVDTIHSLC